MIIIIFCILGLIQGLTEFLPVSSSGHLVLFQNIFTFKNVIDNHFLIVMVHFGTMLAIILFYRKKIYILLKEFINIPKNIKKIGFNNTIQTNEVNFIISIIIGTIPTLIIGIILREWVKTFENNLLIVSFMFLITAIILFVSKIFERLQGEKGNKITILNALIIGMFQGIAVIPGISRSGITITSAIGLRLNKELAASYSFILSLPAIFGATLLEFSKINFDKINIIGTLLAFIIAFIVGYISLKYLVKFIKKGKFFFFGFYVVLISVLSFILAI